MLVQRFKRDKVMLSYFNPFMNIIPITYKELIYISSNYKLQRRINTAFRLLFDQNKFVTCNL